MISAGRILGFFRMTNIVLDILFLNAVFLLILALCGAHGRGFLFPVMVLYMIIINMTWLLCVSYFRVYDRYLEKDSVAIYRQTLKAFVAFCLVFFFISSFLVSNRKALLYQPVSIGHAFYTLYLAAFFVALMINRLILLAVRKNRRYARRRAIVVSRYPFPEKLKEELLPGRPVRHAELAGVFYERLAGKEDWANGLYKGTPADCLSYLKSNNVDEVYCMLRDLDRQFVQTLMTEADRTVTRVRMVLDVYDYLPRWGHVELVNNIPVISLRQEPLAKLENAFLKRAFDMVFSVLVILLVMSWLLPVLALLIKLDSPGPVFFKQKRSGKDNQDFYCLKFRTMKVNADADRAQATRNDKRVTKLGAFLRKSSLDELPQFFNVLIGNMSVVGPRPHMLAHTDQYSALIKQYMVRHFLTPGITGWAQVNGYRGETRDLRDMEKRVEYDVWYLENWSFLLDLKIIFLTVWNVFKGDGKAY